MAISRRLPPADDLAKLALFRSVNVEELPPFLHDARSAAYRAVRS
jgi:hypothetical protein